jgi:hypothetical protein
MSQLEERALLQIAIDDLEQQVAMARRRSRP